METKSVSRMSKLIKSQNFPIITLFAIVFIIFSIGSNFAFLTPVNIKNILNSMVVTALFTVGAACIMISGQIDFSSGAVGTMSGILIATLVTVLGWPFYYALPLTIVVAAAVGFLNATLVHQLKFQAFIATLATSKLCEGFAYVIGQGKSLPYKEPVLSYLGTGKVFSFVPVAIFLAILVFVIYGILLAKTPFGRSVYLIGGNPNASRLAGFKPVKISYILFMNNAVLSGIAGCLVVGRLKSATASGTTGQLFDGIIAAILGGISFGGGSGGIAGAFLGLLIINTFTNGMQLFGLSASWMLLASGSLLLFAVMFDTIMRARKR